jgi:hypothetical protein
MKAKLHGKSNAILTDDEGNFIAIIGCGKDSDITKKIELAIKEHYVVKSVKVDSPHILENHNVINFSADIITEDEEDEIRDFSIEVVATY